VNPHQPKKKKKILQTCSFRSPSTFELSNVYKSFLFLSGHYDGKKKKENLLFKSKLSASDSTIMRSLVEFKNCLKSRINNLQSTSISYFLTLDTI